MKVFKLNFNLNTIFTITSIVLLMLLVSSFFSGGEKGVQTTLTDLVSGIKNDRYSQVDIQDDGRALGIGKAFQIAKTQMDLSLESREDTLLIKQSDLENLTQDKLYDLIRPLDLKESFDAILNPNQIQRASEIYLGDDFTIVVPADPAAKDIFIAEFGVDQFENLLAEKALKAQELPVKIHYFSNEAASSEITNITGFYNSGRYDKLWVLDGLVIGSLRPNEVVTQFVYWKDTNDNLVNFTEFLQREGIKFDSETVKINFVKTFQVPWGDILVAGFLGILIVMAVMMFRGVQSSGSGLMKFGQTKARMFFGRRPDVTFKDVAGIDEAKEELKEIVMFLKDPRRFLLMGARIPKGALMVGAPGTGKTLLARAIAGEAGVPFFHTSGSEFEEMLVGAGASRVRDLFDKAKKAAPSLIFIDEIDAVARKRGTTIQSGTTEQTLNQILVEMDGFEKNTNVIVIAATNRPDVLDPAILRPGRFDRRIVLDLPDIQGRKEIIAIHAKNKPLSKDVSMDTLAKRTVGFSGADIENMLNEAAIIAAKDNRKEITPMDLEEAATKVQVGPQRKRKRTEKELKMTAYHEAAHALVMSLVPESDPVHRVTIVSRGMALGYTMPLPETDQLQMSKTQMLSKIKSLLAGHASEEMFFNDVTSGAANDIEKATNIAKRMVMQFGMSKKLGLVKYGDEEEPYLGYSYGQNKDYSEETAKIIDEEVRKLIGECFEETKDLIKTNKEKLEKIVKVLLEKETIDAAEFKEILE
ncbi:MAG TPA: ATP-dependent zinc metalloprotease FtsH [Candidatus Dojkabacteria bacterium]|nr:ATP-dependent zinc metalloprotease FtsH [Candidatus Dojkabacteria bacterium]